MIKLIKVYLITVLLLVTYSISYGQVASYYSLNGMGMPIYNNNVRSISMGGINNSSIDPYRINYNNPSSYGAFTLTNFDISGSFITNKVSNYISSGRLNTANLNTISIGFPIKENKIGIAMGLQPYMYMNYNAYNKYPADDELNADMGFKGYGSYSTAFIGAGFRIFDNILIGFNFNYLFGNIEKSKYIYLNEPNSYNSKTFLDIDARGLFFNYGISYLFNISPRDKLVLSYSSDIAGKIHTSEDLIYGSYIETNGEEVIIDTVSSINNNNNSFILPFKHTLGILYEIGKKLNVGLDMSFQDWSNIKYKPINDIAASLILLNNQELANSYRISLGAEYVPNIESESKYYKKIEYRAGVKLEKMNVNVNTKPVYAVSVNAGLGLPINRQLFSAMIYDLSYLNIGLGITRQGNISKNMSRETYFSVYLGFDISNRWFIQRKYD